MNDECKTLVVCEYLGQENGIIRRVSTGDIAGRLPTLFKDANHIESLQARNEWKPVSE